MTPLHTTTHGESGRLIGFCHGLFGQGRNWTQIAKQLAVDHRALLIDMPDHGRSPWSEQFDYLAAADQVAELVDPSDPLTLVGHSMGGKIAMLTALRHPELVERLCVVDVAPVAYDHAEEFSRYIEGMTALDLTTLTGRDQADEALREAVPNPTVRSFLLQNLRREGDTWRWQVNLALVRRELDEITGWPVDELADITPYDGKVLWVGGADSAYVDDRHVEAMNRLFGSVRRVTVKDAGHWVHSEQPDVFVQVLRRFLA